jgi:putative FmdB family regulatory protein
MPLYEYECSQCGHRFELIQRFADPPAETCVACGKGPVHKLLSAPAVHFKGTGWYVTDYAKKGSGAAGKTEGGGTEEHKPAGETKPAGDSKPADTKPAGESK